MNGLRLRKQKDLYYRKRSFWGFVLEVTLIGLASSDGVDFKSSVIPIMATSLPGEVNGMEANPCIL